MRTSRHIHGKRKEEEKKSTNERNQFAVEPFALILMLEYQIFDITTD